MASVRDVLDTVLGRGRGRHPHRRQRRVGRGSRRRSPCAGSARTASSTSSSRAARSTSCASCGACVDVPFAVDETIRTVGPTPTRCACASTPTSPCSSRRRSAASRPLLRVAEALDVPVVVSGSLDSSVGLDVARRGGGRARRPAVRLRPRHRRAAGGRRGGASRGPRGRRRAGPDAPRPTCRPCSPRATAWPRTGPPGGVSGWRPPGWPGRASAAAGWCPMRSDRVVT